MLLYLHSSHMPLLHVWLSPLQTPNCLTHNLVVKFTCIPVLLFLIAQGQFSSALPSQSLSDPSKHISEVGLTTPIQLPPQTPLLSHLCTPALHIPTEFPQVLVVPIGHPHPSSITLS